MATIIVTDQNGRKVKVPVIDDLGPDDISKLVSGQKVPGHKVPGHKVPKSVNIGHKVPRQNVK